ncbi:MAG TPA: SRPBCC domain-containing protein [Chitinophagaceae bacterium]|nr:SRPBCC domain-containing protein [Chitinophagaceae bacterium]
MAKNIKHSLFYPHPPEMVWEYLTQPQLIAEWLMPNDFQAVVGHNFQFRTKPMPNVDFNGIVYCQVLEVVPLKKLSFSWKGGPSDGVITMNSVVEWTLVSKDGGTELLLEHSFSEISNLDIFSLMDQGWLKNMHKIPNLINAAKDGIVHT